MKILLIGFGKINKLIYKIAKEQVVGIVDIDGVQILEKPDIIIDFSHPEFLDMTISYSKEYNVPVLIGTTGYNDKKMAKISELSNYVPVLKSDNFSLGIYMIERFLKDNITYLDKYSKKIIETHHESKKDSPSGTALSLKKIISDSCIISKRNKDKNCVHEIILSNNNEEIQLSHNISDRTEFALRAIEVAEWLVNQQRGMYTFEDYIKRI